VKRSNKVCEALALPKVLNLNPRSLYNKVEEFVTFVEEEEIDLACKSESWEREKNTLDKVIKLDDYTIISNIHQRKGAGGRPAIVVNNKKYAVENLTQTVVSIPWGVEAVWAVLTPKNISSSSKIQKIVVGSIYSKPDSRKKSILLDHIAEVYNYLCSKYNRGLHWIICGDTNDLKLDSILHLNKSFKQVVQNPT
jgi:exonuclease III